MEKTIVVDVTSIISISRSKKKGYERSCNKNNEMVVQKFFLVHMNRETYDKKENEIEKIS